MGVAVGVSVGMAVTIESVGVGTGVSADGGVIVEVGGGSPAAGTTMVTLCPWWPGQVYCSSMVVAVPSHTTDEVLCQERW
jgi:hypothetical protein